MKADNICKLELIYIEIHCLLCNVLLSLLYIFFAAYVTWPCNIWRPLSSSETPKAIWTKPPQDQV